MLNNIFFSCSFFKSRLSFRGVAMTEYAILLAFVAAIAAVVFSQGYDITMVEDVTGNDKFVGNNLLSSIWAAIRNAHSMLSRMLSF